MEGVIIAAAVQFVKPEASALLKPLLHEVYTLVKYRIKGVDSLKDIEELVRKLDIEAKLDCVSVLICEIQSNSTTVQTAIRHIHVKLEEIKILLEKLTQEAQLHSKKWLSSWRTSETMIHLMKKLETETKTLNDRVKFLLMLRPLTNPVVVSEALGHRHLLNPLEQSWMLLDSPNVPIQEPFPLMHPPLTHQLPPPSLGSQDVPPPTTQETQTLQEENLFSTQQESMIGEKELKQLEENLVGVDGPIPLDQLKKTLVLQKETNSNLPLEEMGPTERKMNILMGMGFSDQKLNRAVLSQVNNDLQMAISALIKS